MENRRSFLTRATLGVAAARDSSAPAAVRTAVEPATNSGQDDSSAHRLSARMDRPCPGSPASGLRSRSMGTSSPRCARRPVRCRAHG